MLVLAFLITYFSVAIGIQFAQSVRHGYGSGFHNRGHVPEKIAEEAGLPKDVDNVTLARESMADPHHGVWNEIWRIVATFAALIAIVFFWYFVISRLGPL
jgi:hypothetical protein